MKNKVSDNLKRGRYSHKLPSFSFDSYKNKEEGWIDYLLSDKIIFSHRTNDYSSGELPEKLHAHPYYELTIPMTEDGIEYISDGKSTFVHRGMAILSKPMQFHMFRLSEPCCYDRFVIYFKETAGLFADNSIFDFLDMGDHFCASFELPEHALLSYVNEAERELADKTSPYSSAKAILHLCRLFLALSDKNAVIKSNSLSAPSPFIHEIKEFIDENFLKIRSVEELTRQFFYSREYISRSFKQYYNTPIYEYILERKLLNCEKLLQQGASVETAAQNSGFHNMSSFFKLFRKANGCSPSEYRQRFLNSKKL